MNFKLLIILFFISFEIFSQNLIVDGNITNSNVNWGGGASEAPFNTGTYEDTYISGGCNVNYVMEVDNASNPTQVVNGFTNGSQYVLAFRYAWRNTGCSASSNPTSLRIRFSDATGVFDQTVSVPNTLTTFTPISFTLTNNTATTHTLLLTNPGNTNTCGVMIDDLSITRLSSPGGIGTANLSLWFNASDIGIANNSNVYAWLSKGLNNVATIPPCANPPLYFTGLASSANNFVANFNPYITFNGSNQYLEYTAARINLMDLTNGGNGGTYFGAYAGGSNTRNTFGYRGSSDDRIYALTNRFRFANSTSNGTNNDISLSQTSRMNITSFKGKRNGITVKDLNGANLSAANASADIDYLTIGVSRNNAGTYSEYFDNSLTEIIAFNKQLTDAEMQRVRSYLASKYGVTLVDNTTTAGIDERNYVASNGSTTYWNATTNAGYHNNVTVIGRDDNTSLDQRKSVSTDADANGFMTNAMLTINNNAAITNDLSYLAVGHNGSALNLIANTSDVPSGIQSRTNRVWKYQLTGSGVASSVEVTFDMTGFTPLTGSQLRLLVSTTPTFSASTVVAGSYAAPNFTASLSTSGGVYFTIGSTNFSQTPLPIELLDFNAEVCAKKVCLNWSTASEKNNNFFTIEKSKDGINYQVVFTKNGAGNSTTINYYSGEDNKPLNGISYYRLKQTDFDGVEKFASVRSINFESTQDLIFEVFPNPNDGNSVNILLNGFDKKEILVVVYDVYGQINYSKVLIADESSNNIYAIDPSNKLAPGIYFVSATNNEAVLSKKIIVK